ncbi:MAG: NAD-dependent epimerase/dehydratase family protein, partial [Candidatus Norongarragalinales archaeon]
MIIVTGGAGFIGSALARRLLQADEVLVFDDFSSGHRSNLPENKKLRLVKGDIRNAAALNRAFRGANAVYHFAACPDVRECTKRPRLAFD